MLNFIESFLIFLSLSSFIELFVKASKPSCKKFSIYFNGYVKNHKNVFRVVFTGYHVFYGNKKKFWEDCECYENFELDIQCRFNGIVRILEKLISFAIRVELRLKNQCYVRFQSKGNSRNLVVKNWLRWNGAFIDLKIIINFTEKFRRHLVKSTWTSWKIHL